MSEPFRILLVDDDKDSCEMMSVMLTLANTNYEVISANSADEALALMEIKPFDIYILDSLLPDMSGVELCAEVRRGDEQTPILFYSGMLDSNYIKNAKAAGANEYLIKPNDLERFTETVHKYLR
ncbi:MAG TPA: response regulator [Pyrinomonadaceae bacterium]|jgi:DNA-binding response OmpR family regulator